MVNEHRLYEELSKFVIDWTIKENAEGRKPYQSEIVGALEMVKADIYAIHSADRIITQRMEKILTILDGKTININQKDHSITVTQEGIFDKEKKNE